MIHPHCIAIMCMCFPFLFFIFSFNSKRTDHHRPPPPEKNGDQNSVEPSLAFSCSAELCDLWQRPAHVKLQKWKPCNHVVYYIADQTCNHDQSWLDSSGKHQLVESQGGNTQWYLVMGSHGNNSTWQISHILIHFITLSANFEIKSLWCTDRHFPTRHWCLWDNLNMSQMDSVTWKKKDILRHDTTKCRP